MHFECRITACSTQVQATNIRLKISVLELSWRRPHPLANAHEHVTCLVLPVSPYYSLHARSLSHAPALQPSCLLTPGARLSISIARPSSPILPLARLQRVIKSVTHLNNGRLTCT